VGAEKGCFAGVVAEQSLRTTTHHALEHRALHGQGHAGNKFVGAAVEVEDAGDELRTRVLRDADGGDGGHKVRDVLRNCKEKHN